MNAQKSGARGLLQAAAADTQEQRQDGRRTDVLGHFEFAVITAISNLGMNAFPAVIARTLTKNLGRHASLAQVFVALQRLEEKELVSSEEIDPDPVLGGRRRRKFQVETSGLQAIRLTAATYGRTSSPGQPSEVSKNVGKSRPTPSPA